MGHKENKEIQMKIKSLSVGLIMTVSAAAIMAPSQAAWAYNKHHGHQSYYKYHKHHIAHHMHYKTCSGKGWYMVSKRCDIKPAATWQEYTSGVGYILAACSRWYTKNFSDDMRERKKS